MHLPWKLAHPPGSLEVSIVEHELPSHAGADHHSIGGGICLEFLLVPARPFQEHLRSSVVSRMLKKQA